jgi:hypothetical protein
MGGRGIDDSCNTTAKDEEDFVRILHVPARGAPRWRLELPSYIDEMYTRERVLGDTLVLLYNEKRSNHPLNVWLQETNETRELGIRGMCAFIRRNVYSGDTESLEKMDFADFWRRFKDAPEEYGAIQPFDLLSMLVDATDKLVDDVVL